MKYISFGLTSICVGCIAGIISGDSWIGTFGSLGPWFLLISLDQIVNGSEHESRRAPLVPAIVADDLL